MASRPPAGRTGRRTGLLLAMICAVLLAGIVSVVSLPRPAASSPHRPLPVAEASPSCSPCPPAAPAPTGCSPCPQAATPAPRPIAPPPAVSRPIAAADRWAVLVGIQEYAGSTHPTFGGRGDVVAVRAALLRAGWRPDHIRVLTDAAASAVAIRDAMSWLAARSSPQTFSLFHFSGHVCIASRGPCAPGHAYLWSQDNGFIRDSTVGEMLGRVQGRAWFDFAGCEAGALDAGLSSARRLVTGSSQASETAYEEPTWQESVWTGLVWDRGFLRGLAGAPPARATIGQMVAYGRVAAAQITATQSAGVQHPYVAGGDPNQTLYAPRT